MFRRVCIINAHATRYYSHIEWLRDEYITSSRQIVIHVLLIKFFCMSVIRNSDFMGFISCDGIMASSHVSGTRRRLTKVYLLTFMLRKNKLVYIYMYEVLLRVNEQRNILQEIRKRKANWIGHILRRNCLLKQVIEGKIKRRWKWQEDEEEDVRSCWMTLRTGDDILIWRRKL